MHKDTYAIIISGPSGVGKGTLISKIRAQYSNIPLSVSHTTRLPRVGEQDGKDYFFVSKDKFFQLVDAGEFIEWEQVHDNYYGTHFLNIEKSKDTNLLFEIDVKGAINLMEKIKINKGNYISVFLDAPSKKELFSRLKDRGSESDKAIQIRMETTEKELSKKKYFDYIVVNDTISSAFSEIEKILKNKGVL